MGQAMSRIGVGVIGAGAMGSAHARTLAQWVPGADVVAVYDVDLARAREVAAEVAAEASPTSDGLITSSAVDAVVIAAPDPLHVEMALACLAAGKHILCEKPLATGVEGSQRIVDAEVAVGRRLIQVGFMRRYDPAFVELRATVASGAIGTPRVVHCVHRNPRAHPSASSDGVIFNSMIHELDMLPWLLDDALSAVTVSAPAVPEGQIRDPQVALLETVGGVVVTVEVFVNARYGYDVRCEVVGTEGTVRLTPPYGISLRRDGADGLAVGTNGGSSWPRGCATRRTGRSQVPRPGTAIWPTSQPPPVSSPCTAGAGCSSRGSSRPRCTADCPGGRNDERRGTDRGCAAAGRGTISASTPRCATSIRRLTRRSLRFAVRVPPRRRSI
jgi:myo-inositol 2-dehydrogenase/D-chiro-inositol 1-dehydrogenase